MIKILFVGDAVTPTGFSRVTHSLLDRLQASGLYEINAMGINYYPEQNNPHNYQYTIHSAILGGDPYGFKKLPILANSLNPDIIILFNDIWIINLYYKILKEQLINQDTRIVAYFPVDCTGYTSKLCKFVHEFDLAITYTKFGVDVLRQEAGVNSRIEILPHGVNTQDFYPISKNQIREEFELSEDLFIVFNGNRNQPRKRIDLTIKGFYEFAADKPNARLHLHMAMQDQGWDIPALCEREAKKHGLSVEKTLHITAPDFDNQTALTIDQLNRLYNLVDVGINTSLGEGFGLVSLEHAVCGIPQIVTDFAASAELFDAKIAIKIPVDTYLTSEITNLERGLVSPYDVANALNICYYNKDKMLSMAERARTKFTSDEFNWDHIAQKFDKLLQNV